MSSNPVNQNQTNAVMALMGQGQDVVFALAERLDFVNIQILREFYATGLPFPNDTQPHVFSMLYMDMRSSARIKMGLEAFRKRLDFLVSMGLIEKVARSNPASYHPVKGIQPSVSAVITRFMMNHRLSHL